MTDLQKELFLARFARDYDLPAACAKAGVRRGEAYRLLKEVGAADVDRRVQARLTDGVLSAIRAEYEAIAFDRAGDVRPGERIRALEQLRLMTEGEEPPVAPTSGITVVCEYV